MANNYQPIKEEAELLEKWKKRFEKAKNWRLSYQKKWLRMYEIYRAYKYRDKYAYRTKLMPPIAFEIIETVKSRLASAKMNIRILPRSKDDANHPAIESWDSLIKYDLDVMEFDDKKIDWITSALLYGNGVAQLTWKPGEKDDGDPDLEIVDLWTFYPDPEATDLQKDSKYEIVVLYKKKEQIEKEEEARGENRIYKNLEYVENKKITNDPRRERYEINTKKMGQIATGEGEEKEGTSLGDKLQEEMVELWQIWDHEEDRLIVIANGEIVIRDDENPYKNINNGRVFIQLTDHSLPWELWGIGHLEPVETTIHELADSRNQAMDDITITLDPIRKVRKDAHIKAEDIVYEPGAIWQLKRADDVITERPPEISKQWIEKDEILRREIQTALALSEYAMGIPKSAREPLGKVELLLIQTNIRFSLTLRQLEISMTRLVNNLIQLNKEFLAQNKLYRLLGKEVEFKEFKSEDKKIKVDARVEIEPKFEKSPEQRKNEILMLYRIFVAEDKPDPENAEEVNQWKIRKRTLQKLILEEFDRQEYEELIVGEKEVGEAPKSPEAQPIEVPPAPPPELPTITPPEPTPEISPSKRLLRRIASKIPILKNFT